MSNPQFDQLLASAHAGKPEAQFLLSQICVQRQDIDGMVFWLKKASDQGYPDALGALGHCYEKGQGFAVDMAKAMSYYDRAVDAGSKVAALNKAQLLYKSKPGSEYSDLIYDLLVIAATANVVPALRVIGYLAMQHEDKRDLAIDCLRQGAALGDFVSAFILGWCLLQGWSGEGTESEAAFWLQQASSADYPFAAELLTSSSTAKPVAPQGLNKVIDFGPLFPLYPESQGVDCEVFSSDPPITLFKEVLSTVDCAYLMYFSRPYLMRASVIDPEGDSSGMVSDVRTNMSTYLPFEIVDIIGRHIELKIINETGEDLSCSEPMSILRYAPGEYYRPHVDYFNPRLDVSKEFLQDGGQRTASAVTYLTAPTAGGGTSFPNLKVTVPPVAGGTLWFRNCLKNGQIDERSLHAGDTVIDGEKWVVTKWFREKPTQYLQI